MIYGWNFMKFSEILQNYSFTVYLKLHDRFKENLKLLCWHDAHMVSKNDLLKLLSIQLKCSSDFRINKKPYGPSICLRKLTKMIIVNHNVYT